MNRRSFLAGLGLAPVAAASAALAVPGSEKSELQASQAITVKVDAAEAQKALRAMMANFERQKMAFHRGVFERLA